MTNIALIWDSEVDLSRNEPFRSDLQGLRSTYEVFSELAEDRGSKVFVTSFDWVNGKFLDRAFSFSNGVWHKVEDVEFDVVFDKYRFDDETVPLKKKLDEQFPVINCFELERICKDKLLSYKRFPSVVPETERADEKTVGKMLEKHDRVILKPRYDFGGEGIEVIESVDEFKHSKELLVQGLVETSGLESLDIEGPHDLRVYVLNGEVVLSYVRTPEEGLISNVHRGGKINFVEVNDLPEDVFEIVDNVENVFEKFRPCFYAIDMIADENQALHILEFNSKPGLNFYSDDEIYEKKLPVIKGVVELLVSLD